MTSATQRHALVLGGTGFLGRHIVPALLNSDYRVTTLARRPAEVPGAESVSMIIDGNSREAVTDLVTNLAPDVVINATGSIWGKNEQIMRDVVATPTLTVLDALTQFNCPPRFVQLGSILELGKLPVGTTANTNTPSNNPCVYGATKLALTQKALTLFHTGRLAGLVLRIGNICGPGSPEVSLLGRVARVIVEGPPPRRIELDPLTARRDYVDVRDVARAVALAASATVTGEIVGIGRGESVSVRSLVDLMIEIDGLDVQVMERPGARAHSSEDWTCIDPEPARRLLGWQPLISLRDSMADHLEEVRGAAGAAAS